MTRLIDAHTHLHKITDVTTLAAALARASEADVVGAVVCGTSPADWDAVGNLCRTAERSDFRLYAGYGVHPWYVKHLEGSDWQESLRKRLVADPQAHVGEIGIDKHFPDLADLDTQKETMRIQLELAKELSRSVTIHCVKAHAEVIEVLKDTKFLKTGLPMILHSFNGNLEQLDQLTKISSLFFFSVNCKFSRDNVLRRIPLDRLLLESDSPDQLSATATLQPLCQPDGSLINDPAQIRSLFTRVASVRCISQDQLALQLLQNTSAAFQLV